MPFSFGRLFGRSARSAARNHASMSPSEDNGTSHVSVEDEGDDAKDGEQRPFGRSEELHRLLERIARNDPSLRKINLHGRRIGYDGARRLAEALRGNTVVTKLHLGQNNIRDVGARALAEALRNNSSITVLHLWDNSIGDVGAKALAEALRENSTLTMLHLSCNSISDVGATALAGALEVNSSVSELGLERNDISDVGAAALAEALEVNSSISELYLGWNRIGVAGARSLARVLCHNSSVSKLSLSDNSIGYAGARELVEMLQVNASITHLILYNANNYSNKHEKRVGELTKINKDAQNPEDARRLKILCKVGWLVSSRFDREKEEAVTLALDRLGSFPEADQRRGLFEKLLGSPKRGADVAASVDTSTAGTMYRYAADCEAAPSVIMHLLRAHPSLSACRDVRHGLFPFMFVATTAEAGVGDVLELLLLNPTLVESGIGGPVEHCI